jgi:hypothetical protein
MPLTAEIEEKVRHAAEHAMNFQRLQGEARARRWHEIDQWLDDLRNDEDRFNAWYNPIREACKKLNDPEQAERARQRDEANARAEKLLMETLSPTQRAELTKKGYFHVRVGAKRFRITRGTAGNVLEVDAKSRVVRKFCAHPATHVPVADVMLAQKLCIEANPKKFFKIANQHPVRRYRRAA